MRIVSWISLFIILLGIYNMVSAFFSIPPLYSRYLGLASDFIIGFTGFSSLLTGFILTIVGYGLFLRYHFFWHVAVLLLLFSAVVNAITSDSIGVIFSSLLLAYIYVKGGYFSRELPFRLRRHHIAAIWIIIAVLAYGTVASLHIGHQYDPAIESPIQALYYTIITISTVGYGDYIPTTDVARLFTISLIIIGVGCFLTAITILFQPFVKKVEELSRRPESN
jgi:voltage-gated potassium channel